MDKFNRVFQASLGNKVTKLEEADDPLGDIRDMLAAEKKRKDRSRAGKKGAVAGGAIGASVPLVAAAARTSKAGSPGITKMMAKHPKLIDSMMNSVAKSTLKKGAAGLVVGGAAGAGISALRNRKKNVAESVLEEVKERIAARKLEEGIGTTAAALLSKVRGFKPVKQAGNVFKDLKDTAQAIVPRQKLYKGIGKGPLRAAGANVRAVGKGIADTAKANPYGAGLIGGSAGLTAWGLKKPKNVQEAAFDFSKLKDKKGKDKGKDKKDGKKELPAFFKKGDKGKDGEVNPAAEAALAKAKGKRKGKGKVPAAFLKNIKGGDKGAPPAEGGKKELPAFLKK